MTMLLIIPFETQRDCIVHAGRRYCEDSLMSPRTTGIRILLAVAVVLALIFYVRFLVWLWIDGNQKGVIVFGVGLVLPVLILALWLISQ